MLGVKLERQKALQSSRCLDHPDEFQPADFGDIRPHVLRSLRR
jgi:hypothetical protein